MSQVKQVKFLMDRGLDKLAEALREEGFDVVTVEKFATDEEIIEKAEKEDRTIVTKDSYFAEVLFRRKIKGGVIFLGFNDVDMCLIALKGILENIDVRRNYIILG